MSRFKDIILKIVKSLIGFSIILFTIYLATTIFFYSPNDSSFNTVTNSTIISNKTGIFGAFLSDFFIQFFGLTSIILMIYFIKIGFNLIKNKFIRYNIYLKIIMLNFLIITFCFLNTKIFYTRQINIFNMKDGGYIGFYISDLTKSFSNFITIPLFLIVFLISTTVVFDISFRFWVLLPYRIKNFVSKIFKLLFDSRKTSVDNFSDDLEDTDMEFQENDIEELDEDFIEKKDFINKNIEEIRKLEQKKGQTQDKKQKISTVNIGTKTYEKNKKYILPKLNLLNVEHSKNCNITKEELYDQANNLRKILADFKINGKVISVKAGPIITLFEFEPAAGTKSSRIIGLADDIARNLRVKSARISVIENKNAIGIELPNKVRETIYLKEILESPEYKDNKHILPIVLGTNISGETVIIDLAKAPHLLIAGTTGSGKSVSINTMILSLLYRFTPDECKFIMIDPKMLELSAYEGIPHLLSPVVTEPQKAILSLRWVVAEMEERYRLMAKLGVRHISGYNEKLKKAQEEGKPLVIKMLIGYDENGEPMYESKIIDSKPMPYIVVVVDEMADLMITAGKDIEALVQRIAQMARAAGIHIIMATQRPSVDIITGVIKANFPSRISFLVSSRIDSKVIIGEQGAEQLLGYGDMLYMINGAKITRAHGPFVSDGEVEKVVNFINLQGFKPAYVKEILEENEDDDNSNFEIDINSKDYVDGDLYEQAIQIVKRDRKTSISYLQRVLRIGYNKSATLIERMEKDGILTPANSMGKREIIE